VVPQLPTAPVAAGSLIAGFALVRVTGVRPLGAVPLVLGAGWCALRWRRRGGAVTAGLLATYGAAFIGSHPLAKRIGGWPSVLAVAAACAGASWVLADRPH
jgi:hypothetical protein